MPSVQCVLCAVCWCWVLGAITVCYSLVLCANVQGPTVSTHRVRQYFKKENCIPFFLDWLLFKYSINKGISFQLGSNFAMLFKNSKHYQFLTPGPYIIVRLLSSIHPRFEKTFLIKDGKLTILWRFFIHLQMIEYFNFHCAQSNWLCKPKIVSLGKDVINFYCV